MTQGHGLDIKPYGLFTSEASPGRGGRRSTATANAGRRSLLQPDARPARQPDDQHRLRADRGRSAPGQPDALLAVLSRAARLLPRRRDLLRLRQHSAAATCSVNPFFSRRIGLERRRHAAEDRLRHQDHRPGGRPGRRRPARAHRRRRRRGLRRRGLHGRARQAPRAAAVVRRRDLHAARCARRRRSTPATPPASTSGWPRRSFLGIQNLDGHRLVPARQPARASAAATTPSAPPIDYPNDRWDARLRRARGAAELRSGGRLRHAARTTGATSRAVGFGPRPQQPPLHPPRRSSARNLEVMTDLAQPAARARPSSSRSLELQFHSPGQRSASRSTPTYERLDAPFRHQPGHHAAARRRVQLHALRGPRADGQPARARAQRPLRDRRLLLGHAPPDGRRPHASAPGPATSSTSTASGTRSSWPRAASRRTCYPRDRRNAVHAVHGARQQRPVRHGEPRAGLAVALPMDHEARKRPLRGLHPQLAGGPAAGPIRHAGPDELASKVLYTQRF